MKPQFRLQRVLDFRYSQEELAKKELASREQEHRAAVQLLQRLLNEERRLWELMRKEQAGGTRLRQWQQISDFNAGLRGQLQRQEEERQKSWERLEQQRTELKLCWQKRRVLEILRSKAQANHRQALQRREQRALDELVLFAFDGGADGESLLS